MIPAGSSQTAKKLDLFSINSGVPSLILMENAAFSIYETVKNLIGFSENICVFTGSGGNGGDGIALLRILSDRIPELNLYHYPVFAEYKKESDTETNLSLLPDRVVTVGKDFFQNRKEKFLFIDAILGTGLSKNISEELIEIILFINSYPLCLKKVIAVDIPTGLCGNTGNLMPIAVKSDITVSLGILKQGLFLEKGPLYAGKIILGNISMPCKFKHMTDKFLLEPADFHIEEISIDSYKNKNGHVLFIAGENEKLGAIIISAKAFLASGGGLATVALNKRMIPYLAGKHPDIMITDFDSIKELNIYDGFVVGPGLSENKKIIEKIPETNGFAVADAGMFDLFSKNETLFEKYIKFRTVFTPHQGEIKKVIKKENLSYLERVTEFPLTEKSILAAKNTASWIKTEKNYYILPSGARSLAFGGTGDMLTGIIAAMMNGKNDCQNVINAMLLHRESGILLEEMNSARYHSIETLLEKIPIAMERLIENSKIKRNHNI